MGLIKFRIAAIWAAQIVWFSLMFRFSFFTCLPACTAGVSEFLRCFCSFIFYLSMKAQFPYFLYPLVRESLCEYAQHAGKQALRRARDLSR